MADLTLLNASWLGPDARFHDGALVVREGRLRLGEAPDPRAPTLDAAGLRVLPGAIDAHVELGEPGREHGEGIERGTRAALAGGVTTVLDAPDGVPAVDSEGTLERKRALFRERSRANWGLHVQAPFAGSAARAASAVVRLARSGALPAVHPDELSGVLRAHRRVCVFAEDETRFRPGSEFVDRRSHHLQRPVEAVESGLMALERALRSIPAPQRPRVVLCHMSTRAEVAWLEHAKSMQWDVWGATCPCYWRLTERDYVREGARLKASPPLRSEQDALAILDAVCCGTVDLVSSGHAPHAPEEKEDDALAPAGLPGLEWHLPLLLELVDEGHVGWSRLAELAWANAARCFGIHGRAAIAEGLAADLVLVRKGSRPGPKPRPITVAGGGPYADVEFAFQVEATVVGGRLEGPRGEEVISD